MCVDVLTEGSKLAMRSPYMTDDRGYGKFDWFEGHVAGIRNEPDDLWESLWISWGGGEDGEERNDEARLAAAAAAAAADEEGGGASSAAGSSSLGKYVGAQPGEGEGDLLSPWEVEVHGVQPWQAVRMPERLQVALVSSLSAVARTEAMALLDDKDTAAAHTSAGTMAGTAAAMGSAAALEASCVAGSSSSAAAASSMAGGVVVGVVGVVGAPASSSSSAAASLNPAAAAASARAAAAEMGRTAPVGMLTRREAELAETTRFKAALVPIDLKLVLARLKAGYYRQWAAVKHDLELLLARLSSSPSLAPLAEAVAPALYAAVSEDTETRRTWQALHDAAVSSGEMGRAMAMARPKGKAKMAGGGFSGVSLCCSHSATKSAFSAQPEHVTSRACRKRRSSFVFIFAQSTSAAPPPSSSSSSASGILMTRVVGVGGGGRRRACARDAPHVTPPRSLARARRDANSTNLQVARSHTRPQAADSCNRNHDAQNNSQRGTLALYASHSAPKLFSSSASSAGTTMSWR